MERKVIALRHGVVSLHPEPKGVIHFIGGYFFGTNVRLWYGELLEQLKQKFTVHSYPYSFTQLSHWKLAENLLEEIEQVKLEGMRAGRSHGYQTDVYTDPNKYCLVGHSLGCECISLIRFLGLSKVQQLELLQAAQQELGSHQVTAADFSDVESIPELVPVPYQNSLIMAPCFKTPTGLSAFLKVRPQEQLMQYLIGHSDLLPVTSLISFKGDTIALNDVNWIKSNLQNLKDYQLIDDHHAAWLPVCHHMTPAFDPIDSGLAACASDFISKLVQA